MAAVRASRRCAKRRKPPRRSSSYIRALPFLSSWPFRIANGKSTPAPRGMSSNKAAAYSSRSAWGGDAAGTPEHPYSAIAAAAYVARTKTWDKRYTRDQDYSRKTDLV
jgi:hypothetical protein